jgi:ferredoxin
MRISIDQDKCCAAGNCVLTVPEVFDQDDDGLVIALTATVPADLESRVRLAADQCPGAVITLSQD